MEETTVATIVLTVACGRTSHKDPVIQLGMRESVLRLAQWGYWAQWEWTYASAVVSAKARYV
jgi:hypothetical protein